jgi:tetrahydromethanopterin S-methyltransferase subunit H
LPAPFEGWTEQKLVTIGGRVLGGLPGLNPMWLIASIFYMGDRHLRSESGDFDREAVRKSVEDAVSIADKYGLVFALDVIFPSAESVDKILPFMAEFDIPLFLDSPDPNARAKSYRLAGELGLQDRVVANGIYVDSSDEELKALSESGIKTAVVMAFDPRNPYESMPPENRIRILEEKLIPMARSAGVENIIVDAIVIDPASIALSAETILLVKKRYGFQQAVRQLMLLGLFLRRLWVLRV